jgi:hypothetical protein
MSANAPMRLDAEVIELLRDSPDLLAVADAIGATQEAPARGRARAALLRFAAVAAIVAFAAVLALVSPWESKGSGFVARALAALGDGQVIHVVSVSEVSDRMVLDLKTGTETPVQARTEIWFDERRGLQRTSFRIGGAAPLEELQTPAGAWTGQGRVYTCAWIASHPLAAIKARVSCDTGGDGRSTLRHVPELRPALDPALAGFVGGYQAALADGSAVRDGSGVVGGRAVEWLRFERDNPGPRGEPVEKRVERVAVDSQTLKPVLIETIVDGRPAGSVRIASIETLAPSGVDFARPTPTPPAKAPLAASVTSQKAVALHVAAAALAGRLLTTGRTLDGLPRTSAKLLQIVTGYGADSGVPPTHSHGVEVLYGGPLSWSSGADYVVLKESLRPEMLYGFSGLSVEVPAPGSLAVSSFEVNGTAGPTGDTIWRGRLQHDGVYVAIEATSKTLLVDAARALSRKESN